MVQRLIPGDTAPTLAFKTHGHGTYDLSAGAPGLGTYVFFHRGRHCKWTRFALKDLDDRIGDFAIRDIRVVAISADSAEQTAQLQEEMQLIRLPLGHSVDAAKVAADWGLYLTRNSAEPQAPALHFEPAQVWVAADNTVGAISVQSLPNMWPDITQTLRGIENTSRKFPERGKG
jgi:peroxiredoxin